MDNILQDGADLRPGEEADDHSLQTMPSGAVGQYTDGVRTVLGLFGRRIAATGYDYPPIYLVVCWGALSATSVAAFVQRIPVGLTWQVWLGLAFAMAPPATNLAFGVITRVGLAANGLVATALLLTIPVDTDLAPGILIVTISMVSSTSAITTSLPIGAAYIAMIVVASAVGHLATTVGYIVGIGFGWMIGYMFLMQIRLLRREREATASRTVQATIDERQRIAREVHDVIAHSLSITLLHLTAARRALQQDRDIDDAVESLADAERIGRQAMADIRHTVNVLNTGADTICVTPTLPQPGIDDIPALVQDFRRADVEVDLHITGDTRAVSGATALALYRITQESLANAVKHAPDSDTSVIIDVDRTVEISIRNAISTHDDRTRTGADDLAASPYDGTSRDETTYNGSGLRGMSRRAQLLGGAVVAGRSGDTWIVSGSFPAADGCATP